MEDRNEQSLFNEIESFNKAWDKGDAAEAASFYTDDSVRVGAFGDIQHGKDVIEAAYDKLFSKTMQGFTAKLEKGSIRMLSQEFAAWQGGIELISAEGTSVKGHAFQVMEKVKGRWLVLEAHVKFYPPPNMHNTETPDYQSIRRLINSFQESWNNGNAKELASFFTEDGFRVGPDGDIQNGQAELETAYGKMIKTMKDDTTLEFEPGRIRVISPELATWQARLDILVSGKPSVKGYSFILLKKAGGKWLIYETHPKSFPHDIGTDDEKSIFAAIQSFGKAWSKGDAKEAASFFAEDAVRVGSNGHVLNSKAEIEALYDKVFETGMKGAAVKYQRGNIRMLSPELAIWQGGSETYYAGSEFPVTGYEVDIMKKMDGRWLIIEGHPKLFPPHNA